VVGGLPPFPNVTHSSLSFPSPLFSLYPIPITQIYFLALDAMWTGCYKPLSLCTDDTSLAHCPKQPLISYIPS